MLTKYDAFVGEKLREAVEDMEEATADDWRNARVAAQEHIADLRGYLESTMGYGVKVQEVSKARKGANTVRTPPRVHCLPGQMSGSYRSSP